MHDDYDRMWNELDGLIKDCFRKGAFVFASLLYTARIDSAKNIKSAGTLKKHERKIPGTFKKNDALNIR